VALCAVGTLATSQKSVQTGRSAETHPFLTTQVQKDGENIRALVNKFMRDAACLPLLWVKAGGDNTTMQNMPPFLGADNAELKKHLLMSLFRELPAHFLKSSGAEAPGAAFTNLVSADGASCAALINPRWHSRMPLTPATHACHSRMLDA
jgi:hypothetical protein